MITTDVTPKEFGNSFSSDHLTKDYRNFYNYDEELFTPETDAKKRKIGCYTCIAICVIFWSLIIYIFA